MSNFTKRGSRERLSPGRKLKTPWSSVSWPKGASVGVIIGLTVLFVLLTLLGLAIMVGAAVVLVINIIDITNVGPNFWNILWIVLSGLVILGGVRQSVS